VNEVPHIDYTLEGIVSEQASALGAPEVQTVLPWMSVPRAPLHEGRLPFWRLRTRVVHVRTSLTTGVITREQDSVYRLHARRDRFNEEPASGAPTISTVLALEVDSAEVRCMKGDCNQDYAPG